MKRLIYILAFITSLSVNAQKQAPPKGAAAKDFKLSEKKSVKLPNGLKTTMVQYGTVPKVNISLMIKSGNVHEGENQVWLADLMARMLKEGTTEMNFAALSKAAAKMGGNINVNVGVTQTTISGSVLSEYAPEFIGLISQLVIAPAFPASALDRIKGDLKRQLAVQKAVPQAQAQEKFYQAVYGDHPYGKFFPTEEMINSYTVEMVKDYYKKNYGAKRSVLYIVGKFDEAKTSAAVKKGLGGWQAGPDISYPTVKTKPVGDTFILERKGAPQTTLFVGLPVVTPTHKDYVPLLVANSLLGGSFGSRITSNIRENKGYTYSPFSSVSNRVGSSLWYEQADVTSEHTAASMMEIEKEIKKLQQEAPAKEELQGIQNYEAGVFVLRNSSPGGIIGQLNFLDLYGLPDSYLSTLVKSIHAVTPEKVSEMVRNYIQYEKMTKVLVGDREQIQKQFEKNKPALKAF